MNDDTQSELRRPATASRVNLRLSVLSLSLLALVARLLMFLLPPVVLLMPLHERYRRAIGMFLIAPLYQTYNIEAVLPHLVRVIYLSGFFGLVWFLSAYFARVMAELAGADGGDDGE